MQVAIAEKADDRLKNIVATIQDKTSAIMNVNQTVHIISPDCLASCENPHATGNTNRNCLKMETQKQPDRLPWHMLLRLLPKQADQTIHKLI